MGGASSTGSSGSPSPVSKSTGGDARVLNEPSTEVRQGKDRFLSFVIASQKANIPVIPCTVVADRCWFEPKSPDTLIPPSMSPSHWVNLETSRVVFLRSTSSPSGTLSQFHWHGRVWDPVMVTKKIEDTCSIAHMKLVSFAHYTGSGGVRR